MTSFVACALREQPSHLIGHCGCDLVLNRERALPFAIKPLRPEVISVADVDDLGRNPRPIPFPAHRPLDNHSYVQRFTDASNVLVTAPERKRRSARGDPKALDLRQRIDNLVRDASGEIVLSVIGTEVLEWKYSHGTRSGVQRRRGRRRPPTKDRLIASFRHLNQHKIGASSVLVESPQSSPQPARLDANDRIGCGIKRRTPAVHLRSNGVLLQVASATKLRFYDKPQEAAQPGGP